MAYIKHLIQGLPCDECLSGHLVTIIIIAIIDLRRKGIKVRNFIGS